MTINQAIFSAIVPDGSGNYFLFSDRVSFHEVALDAFDTLCQLHSHECVICVLPYPDGEGRKRIFAITADPDRRKRVTGGELLQLLDQDSGSFAITPPELSPERDRYTFDIRTIRELIAAGEVYQVNYTGRFRFGFSGSPLALFRELLREQPVEYAAYVDTGERQILSLSPELFFRLDGRRIITRPMKGTIARGGDPESDAAAAAELAASEKNRAENLMIVDLLRNDLGRIAVPGSVHVSGLFNIEQYETLYQMTSTVEARIRKEVGPGEILDALFPCGSITGAPKIRSMQVIDELEDAPRGIYTGAIGHFAPDGSALFNVAIRTIEIQGYRGVMGAGGGIVADSDPEEEYDECLLKAGFLRRVAARQDFLLIETMLFDGGYRRLERHLDRLCCSAQSLNFPCDRETVERRLSDYAKGVSSAQQLRIRLVLERDGGIRITSESYTVSPEEWTVALWTEPVDSSDPFLLHKTSWRPWFEAPFAAARERGCADMLLVNERGELTQGCISNLFVEMDGVLFTPPLACGVLPGVLRAELLQEPSRCVERILYPEDLDRAQAVYLGSSLRGLRRVRWIY